jgi:hypothetical protein
MLAFVGDYNALQQYIAQKGVSGFILVFGAVFAILVYAIVLLRIKKKSSLHNEQ